MSTATARTLITRAFRRIGLISEDEGLTAEQTTEALDMLNDMLAGWEAEGIQYVHTADLTLDDVVNVPDYLTRSAMWMLCDDVADEYGKTLTDRQQIQIARARNALQAYFYSVPRAVLDDGIQGRVPYGTFDIRRG